MAEDLALWCGNLSLSTEEESGVTLCASEIEEIGRAGELCLMGGLVAEKSFNKEAFRATMAAVWGLRDAVSFHEVGDKIFIIKFRSKKDLDRIWGGRPWSFDRNPLVLQKYDGLTQPNEMDFSHEAYRIQFHILPFGCMTREVARSIGESVGMVERIDVNHEGQGWGKFLRVKTLIDLTKPLARGRMLHLPSKKVWISFEYERLPRLCFSRGTIKHSGGMCQRKEERMIHGEETIAQYGSWLRAGSRRIPTPNRAREQEAGQPFLQRPPSGGDHHTRLEFPHPAGQRGVSSPNGDSGNPASHKQGANSQEVYQELPRQGACVTDFPCNVSALNEIDSQRIAAAPKLKAKELEGGTSHLNLIGEECILGIFHTPAVTHPLPQSDIILNGPGSSKELMDESTLTAHRVDSSNTSLNGPFMFTSGVSGLPQTICSKAGLASQLSQTVCIENFRLRDEELVTTTNAGRLSKGMASSHLGQAPAVGLAAFHPGTKAPFAKNSPKFKKWKKRARELQFERSQGSVRTWVTVQ